MWIKIRHVPNKEGEMFPRRKNIPKGGDMRSGSNQHMRGVANRGETKMEIMVLGGGQTIIG